MVGLLQPSVFLLLLARAFAKMAGPKCCFLSSFCDARPFPMQVTHRRSRRLSLRKAEVVATDGKVSEIYLYTFIPVGLFQRVGVQRMGRRKGMRGCGCCSEGAFLVCHEWRQIRLGGALMAESVFGLTKTCRKVSSKTPKRVICLKSVMGFRVGFRQTGCRQVDETGRKVLSRYEM